MANRIAPHLEKPEARPAAGGLPLGELSRLDVKQWLEPAQNFIAKHPSACLASAFVLGAAIAWWIKRR